MPKKIVPFLLLLTFGVVTTLHAAFAVDVLDVFKFNRDIKVKLQENVPLYDPVLPHGIMSPFTGYIGQVVNRLTQVNKLSEVEEFKAKEELRPGQCKVEFVDPTSVIELQDDVLARNYIGVRQWIVLPASTETVFKTLTDYNNLEHLIPGMEDSNIVERHSNRVDVETWRKADASVFGQRKSYYRTTNIFWPKNNTSRYIFKSQLQVGNSKHSRSQGLLFMDSLWYLESCGPDCTVVFNLAFSILRWDYSKTPAFFPFVAKEMRRKVIESVLGGNYRTAFSFILKFQDPRFKQTPLDRLSKKDKKTITQEADARIKQLKDQGAFKVDLDESGNNESPSTA